MGKEKKELTPLERLLQQAIGNGVSLGNASDPARGKWPNVWEWLSTVDAGDDFLKEPCSIRIALVPGGVQGALTDPSLGCTVDATSETLEGLFEGLERNLQSAHPTIRTWRKGDLQLRKKPKKNVPKD